MKRSKDSQNTKKKFKKNANIVLELQKSDLNVSSSGKIYECAKSRRARHRLALSEGAETAKPLGRGGKRGPNQTSSITMIRHVHEDDDPGDEEKYKFKAQLRITKIRQKFRNIQDSNAMACPSSKSSLPRKATGTTLRRKRRRIGDFANFHPLKSNQPKSYHAEENQHAFQSHTFFHDMHLNRNPSMGKPIQMIKLTRKNCPKTVNEHRDKQRVFDQERKLNQQYSTPTSGQSDKIARRTCSEKESKKFRKSSNCKNSGHFIIDLTVEDDIETGRDMQHEGSE